MMTVTAATAIWCCLLGLRYMASFQSSYRYYSHHRYPISEINKIRLIIKGFKITGLTGDGVRIQAPKVLLTSKKMRPQSFSSPLVGEDGWTSICPLGAQLPPEHWQDLHFSLEWLIRGSQSRNKSQCACRVTLGPVLSQSHEYILEGIFCGVRVSSWLVFGETRHLCTRPC